MKQQPYLTDKQHIRLVAVGDSFWEALGVLAAAHIAQMPESLEDVTTAHLQDKCSIYGTRFDEYLPAARAKHKELNP